MEVDAGGAINCYISVRSIRVVSLISGFNISNVPLSNLIFRVDLLAFLLALGFNEVDS